MVKKIFKYIIICIILILSIGTLAGCKKQNNGSGNDKPEVAKEIYEEPLRNYMEGLKTKNIELVHKAYPEYMRTMTQSDIDSIYNEYEKRYGTKVYMEYKLGDAVRIKDEKDLKKLESQIKEYCPQVENINVSDAYIVTVELSIVAENSSTPQQEGEQPASEGENANNEAGSNAEGTENIKTEEQRDVKKTDSQDFYVYCNEGNWYFF